MKPEDLSLLLLLETKCEQIYRKYMPIAVGATTGSYDISEYSAVSYFPDHYALILTVFY
jgi:hypothetical protein